jgi:linoleoyl-CoA desaturase
MSPSVSFSKTHHAIGGEIRRTVNEYFTANKIRPTGNWMLYHKTIILLAIAGLCYYTLVFTDINPWLGVLTCIIFGLDLAAIGFNVMHDGAHGSYSRKQWVNDLMAYSLNAMGGVSLFWKMKHNVVHHTYTNIEEHDEDVNIKPLLRTNAFQKKLWIHQYQHIYCWGIYMLTYFWWVFIRDFTRYKNGTVEGYKIEGINAKEKVIFWLTKIWYFAVYAFLPIYMVGFLPWLLGFFIVMFVCGFTLAIVFQLAHVVEETEFVKPETYPSAEVDQDWWVHQLATTANFATDNKIINWYVGGLNFQVEHHLFPRVSHVHYPAISKLVKQACDKFGVKYNNYPTMLQAIKSHYIHMKEVGNAPPCTLQTVYSS